MAHLSVEREPFSCFSSCLQRSISTAFIPSTGAREKGEGRGEGERESEREILIRFTKKLFPRIIFEYHNYMMDLPQLTLWYKKAPHEYGPYGISPEK